MAPRTLMTVEDVRRLPDDDLRYDLIDGELICMAPAGEEHGALTMGLGARIWNFVRQRALGTVFAAETGFVLRRSPDVLMGPDIAFVRADRLPPGRDRRGFLEVAPDLVVEVISPSERRSLIDRKVKAYLDGGVRMLLLVYPRRRRVTLYQPGRDPVVLREGDVFDGGDVLPGFRLPVAEIFR